MFSAHEPVAIRVSKKLSCHSWPNICAGFARECAEVGNLAVPALGYKDDGSLDVTMNEPFSMGGIP